MTAPVDFMVAAPSNANGSAPGTAGKTTGEPWESPPAGYYDEDGAPAATVESDRLVWTLPKVIDGWAVDGPMVHEPTGIALLDDRTGGGPVYGSRWYLNGAPDAGKTALLVEMGDVFARRGICVGLLMVDEEPTDATMRFAQRAGFTRVECEKRDATTLREIHEALSELPIRLYGAEHTIESAAADLEKFARERKARAMFGIDSAQTVTCDAVRMGSADGREMSVRDVVTANVRAVRDVATRYKFIAVSTSEMNRGAYRSIEAADTTNDLASGAESRAIEYSARVLLAMRSVKNEPDLAELRLAKNKHGPSWRSADDSIYLRLDRTRMRYEQTVAPDRPDPDEERGSRGRDRVVSDAVAVLLAVAGTPGIGVRELHAELRAVHGSFSKERAGAGLARLGNAIARVDGGRGHRLYVEGAHIPADVMAKAPLDRRGELGRLSATATEVSE